jgi:hypothetical protein
MRSRLLVAALVVALLPAACQTGPSTEAPGADDPHADRAGPGGAALPGEPVEGADGEAAEVLGGLVTLLRDEVLACAGDRELPTARRVEAEDPGDLWARVGELRALPTDTGPVPLDRLSDEAMTARVAEAFGGYDDEDAARERRLLATLGAVPPDADLRRLRVDVFADQVSGLYQRGEQLASVRVRDPDGPLSPLEQVVAAHELQHALADRHLGRPAQAREAAEGADERRASLAVVEGDASLTMHLYAERSLTAPEMEDLRAQLLERAAGEPLADYPPYLRDELRFPYTDGLAFVCERWRRGGWPAVDALYEVPPATSAQILWPERYEVGEEPIEPDPPARPGGPWEEVRDAALPAADLLWLLAAPGGDPERGPSDARDRAAAWAGGRVLTYADGDASAVGFALTEREGEPDLCDSVAAWWTATAEAAGGTVLLDDPDAEGEVLRARADDERVGVVRCDGERVGVGVAPDLATARRLAQPTR